MMKHPIPALATYSDSDLRDELAARAAATRGEAAKPVRKHWYGTKEEWASANLQRIESMLAKLRDERVPMGPKLSRQKQQIENLEAEARTWRRRVQQYSTHRT